MNDKSLEQAINFAKAGKKSVARKILADLLKQEPNNENIWLWLSFCIDDYSKKRLCLQRAAKISPNNPKIQHAFSKLDSEESEDVTLKSTSRDAQNQIEDQSSVSEVTNIIINQSSSIEFIPAKCPNCGGELRVPNDRNIIKCMYCGYDIVIHDPSKDRNGIDVSNVLRLARVAEKGENFLEAYQGYSKVLENSPNNIDAWLGKGYTAGMLSTVANSRFDEAIACFEEAIKIANDSETNIWSSLAKYALAICNKDSQLAQKIRNKKAIEINLGTYINSPDYSFKLANEKYSSRLIEHFDILIYIWELKPSFDIGYAIDYRMGAILSIYRNDSDSLSKYQNQFNRIRDEINLDSQLKKLKPSWKSKTGSIMSEINQTTGDDECFIATATLGDKNHKYVRVLSEFRDEVLLKTRIGNMFVNAYYRFGPTIASYISGKPFFRFLSLNLIVRPSAILASTTMAH